MTTRNGITLLFLAALTLLAGCKGGPQVEAKATDGKARNPLEITVSDSLLKQVRVGEPEWDTVAGTMRVAGRVEADETRLGRVSAPVTGRVVELDVVEGQNVRRGQTLAIIRSTDLADAQFAFLKAYSQQQLAGRAVERAKLLLEAGVIGEAELQRREAEYVQAGAEVSSARDQLRVLGLSDETIAKLETTRAVNSVTPVVATIDGTVLERKITIGQVIQPAETMFVLADLSRVWLVADVPEQTAGRISVGKSVEAEIAARPGHPIRGALSFVSAIVNPETRTVRARMNAENPDRALKPAMLATMLLQDGSERERMVPLTAVVRENNHDHVFVQTAPDRFVLRRVTLGAEFGEARVLAGGLTPGERIVLDGAFHLNNERKRLALQGS